jgi:hypothetical protein
LELHLLLLDEGCLVDLVGGLHGQLPLQHIQHVVRRGVHHPILVIHEFLHHLAVDEHLVHGLLEVLQVVGHDFKVGAVIPVGEHVGHLFEAAHDGLVVLHGLHVAADELHLETHPLDVHR